MIMRLFGTERSGKKYNDVISPFVRRENGKNGKKIFFKKKFLSSIFRLDATLLGNIDAGRWTKPTVKTVWKMIKYLFRPLKWNFYNRRSQKCSKSKKKILFLSANRCEKMKQKPFQIQISWFYGRRSIRWWVFARAHCSLQKGVAKTAETSLDFSLWMHEISWNFNCVLNNRTWWIFTFWLYLQEFKRFLHNVGY